MDGVFDGKQEIYYFVCLHIIIIPGTDNHRELGPISLTTRADVKHNRSGSDNLNYGIFAKNIIYLLI